MTSQLVGPPPGFWIKQIDLLVSTFSIQNHVTRPEDCNTGNHVLTCTILFGFQAIFLQMTMVLVNPSLLRPKWADAYCCSYHLSSNTWLFLLVTRLPLVPVPSTETIDFMSVCFQPLDGKLNTTSKSDSQSVKLYAIILKLPLPSIGSSHCHQNKVETFHQNHTLSPNIHRHRAWGRGEKWPVCL